MERTQQGYRVRWKGRETGPLPLEEIERRLRNREVGLMHEIEDGSRWLTLREFFGTTSETPASPPSSDPAPHRDGDPLPSHAAPFPFSFYLPVLLLFLLLLAGAFLPAATRAQWADPLGGAALFLGLTGAATGILQLQRNSISHALAIAGGSLLLSLLVMALASNSP